MIEVSIYIYIYLDLPVCVPNGAATGRHFTIPEGLIGTSLEGVGISH